MRIHELIMKIILSRKGFDSSFGGVASPILPSGEMCTLPIPQSPDRETAIHYQDIRYGDLTLGKLVQDLTRGKIAPGCSAHLDPDLNYESLTRLPGWKPLFGQAGAAEGHLRKKEVSCGDLFLFYGWFRQVEFSSDGVYRFVPGARELHVLFGWLQIERRIDLEASEPVELWMRYHPHCQPSSVPCHSERSEESEAPRYEILRCAQNDMSEYTGIDSAISSSRSQKHDSLYVASDRLRLPGINLDVPGAGVFRRYNDALCLTDPNQKDENYSRCVWRLPEWLFPQHEKKALTYHPNTSLWKHMDGYTQLRSASRGQEFVLDCDDYPQAAEWAAELLNLTSTMFPSLSPFSFRQT
jgi:hypothetical protein